MVCVNAVPAVIKEDGTNNDKSVVVTVAKSRVHTSTSCLRKGYSKES